MLSMQFCNFVKIKIFLCLTTCVLCLNSNAQTAWTLEKRIDYAIKNNISIKQMEIAQKAAKTDLTSAQKAKYAVIQPQSKLQIVNKLGMCFFI